MNIVEAREEYQRALRLGQKEYKQLLSRDEDPSPAVLEAILPDNAIESTVDVGLVEIPAERIVGTKTAGRIAAFTPAFCRFWVRTASLPISG